MQTCMLYPFTYSNIPIILHLCASNELELSWDPLEASGRNMSTASKSLVSGKPLFRDESKPPGDGQPSWTECFVSDACVCEDAGKELLSPIGTSLIGSDCGQGTSEVESPLRNDVPNLVLQPGM